MPNLSRLQALLDIAATRPLTDEEEEELSLLIQDASHTHRTKMRKDQRA